MTSIDFTPLVNAVLEGLAGILLALASAATAYLLRKFKLDGDAKLRDSVLTAVTNAVDYGLAKAKQGLDPAVSHVGIQSIVVAHAADYLNQQIPDTMKKLGVGDVASVERLVTAEIGGRMPGGSAEAPPLAVKDKVLEGRG